MSTIWDIWNQHIYDILLKSAYMYVNDNVTRELYMLVIGDIGNILLRGICDITMLYNTRFMCVNVSLYI